MNKYLGTLLGLILMGSTVFGQIGVNDPLLHWSFDKNEAHATWEAISGARDSIDGKFVEVDGVIGKAIRFDGFTCNINHQIDKVLMGHENFTIESWVALAAYPWNWCPVMTQFREEEGGFSFEIGPRGELGLKTVVAHNTVVAITDETIPLYQWTHIAASFTYGKGIVLYINGVEKARYETSLRPNLNVTREARIGMNYEAVYPSDRIGQNGITPYWFSIDGILDEVKVYSFALTEDQLKMNYSSLLPLPKPEIPERHLPRVTSTGKFKAYYTNLRYYPEWDEQWPVGADPDIVVTFKDSPVKLIFWKGSRYSPAWVTENNLWMADQSVETWNGPMGCLEHMQDRHCKYSHVRIIENTDARKVIHWRYAPVSAYNDLWVMNEKTGWECWIDEYYIIYPDATAIRKYTWKTEYMGYPRQFQESIPFTEEGQLRGDVMEVDYLKVANLEGDIQSYQYVENPGKGEEKKAPDHPNIQRHNFRSDFDPFIIFEPGNRMHYMADRNIKNLSTPGSCNHWPVGQAYCDGRRVFTADRPTSFLGFPISDPVVHDGDDGRSWINSLYGMKNVGMDQLVQLARSWATAPELKVIKSPRFENRGYDMSEKMYRLSYVGPKATRALKVKIEASANQPLFNPAIYLENWGEGDMKLTMNGRRLTNGKDYLTGQVDRLDGIHRIIWLRLQSQKPVEIEVGD